MGKLIAAIVAGVLLLIVGITVLFGSWYTVDQGERAVLLTNGAYAGTEGPGLHFKTPWFQSVVKISTRQHVIKWSCPANATACEQDTRLEMLAYSKDQQVAAMRVTVNFHIPDSEVANAYANFGSLDALADRIIARKAPQEVKTLFGQYDAVSVIQNRAEFNSKVTQAVTKAIDGPVMVDSVQVENIDFSDAYEQAVEARMTAQVEVQKKQQELLKEDVAAKIALTQATGRANSVKAEADADAYATVAKGKASADAIKLRAQALADNPGLIELTRAERWDGKLPTTMLPNGTVPFLDVAPR